MNIKTNAKHILLCVNFNLNESDLSRYGSLLSLLFFCQVALLLFHTVSPFLYQQKFLFGSDP